MTNPVTLAVSWRAFATTFFASAFVCAPAAPPSDAATEDFSAVAQTIVQLLQKGDPAQFAKDLAPTLEDWRAVRSTNVPPGGDDPLGTNFQKSLDRQRANLESNARRLMARAAELKVDFPRLRLTAKSIPPKHLGSFRNPALQAENESVPWAEKLEVVLTAEPLPDAKDAERLRGEYKLALLGLEKFPAGWRCAQGAQWISFPATVADAKTQREMAILVKASAYQGINQDDDPALQQLGEALARFVRARDPKVYENEAMLSVDAIWTMIQKMADSTGRKGPPREELDKQWAMQRKVIFEPAQAMVKVMEHAGIDLKDAEMQVKAVTLERLTARGGADSLDGLDGSQLEVALTVKSDRRTRSGKPLAGEYIIAAEESLRIGERWYVSRPVRWAKLPEGVVDEKTLKDLEFESYVARHGTLPRGTAAPDIEFVRVDNEQKGKLSDWRGKIVILDFWATWCGPCQEPMAKMQKYREDNPQWKDQVEIVSLSIDDTPQAVHRHLQKRGWTNTVNLWAGPGGWASGPAKAFRVRGVPTCYVLDANGKIVQAGHPMGVRAPETVNHLLK